MIIRNATLADLSQPPVLSQLAELGGISETKMKQLFKQTFGDTVYNYYQHEHTADEIKVSISSSN